MQKPVGLALALLSALSLFPGRASFGQDGSKSRELAALVEEQQLLERQIQRLRGTMELLLERIEAEGRTHTADLLRNALVKLDERSGTDAVTPLTLEERMEHVRTSLDEGKLAQSLEHQEALVADLERLLAILLDRENLEALEKKLEGLRALDEALDELADREDQLREATEKLREASSNEAQKELEATLAELAKKERELLERTEALGRSSGTAELEALVHELEHLIADQRTDSEVLDAYDPFEVERLDAAREPLTEAQREEARAARLEDAAAEAARAAAELASGDRARLEELKIRLAESAERAETSARISRDPAAEKVAEALRRAAQALDRAAKGELLPAEAARALEDEASSMEGEAASARAAAQARRAEARRELQTGGSEAPLPSGEEVDELLEQAEQAFEDGAAEEARASTERASEALERSRTEQSKLTEALAASQADAAERTQRIERGLETLPEGKNEAGRQASENLSAAAESMRAASERTRSGALDEAAASAEQALEALERSLEALERSRGEAASSQQDDFAELAQEQAELARELSELETLPPQASLEESAREGLERALVRARSALESAQNELAEGRSSSAAGSEREALEELRNAGAQAQAGVRPSSPEERRRAEELAREQEEIREKILDLARRIQEEQEELDAANLARAETAAGEAAAGLRAGDLAQAGEKEREVERELRRLQDELKQEEERYQRLRQEEQLFRLGEELQGMIETHRTQAAAVVEIDAERANDDEPTRSLKLRLRRIAREEEALGSRSQEMSAAIQDEGAQVSAQLLANAASDLERIANLLAEEGEYQTGERTQFLQRDVEQAFEWLLESLRAEQARREQQDRQDQQGEQAQTGENRPGLVPDSAELKLLRRMEVDVQEAVKEVLDLHPELSNPDDVDDNVLRDITRLAGRHETITRLFRSMRERLGIDKPEQDAGEVPEEN